MKPIRNAVVLIGFVLGTGAPAESPAIVKIRAANIEMRLDASGRATLSAIFNGKTIPIGPPSAAESILIDGNRLDAWPISKHMLTDYSDQRGPARRLTVTAASGGIEKQETIDAFERYGRMLVINVQYSNRGARPVRVDGWRNAAYIVAAG